jgi:hypothetical protein
MQDEQEDQRQSSGTQEDKHGATADWLAAADDEAGATEPLTLEDEATPLGHLLRYLPMVRLRTDKRDSPLPFRHLSRPADPNPFAPGLGYRLNTSVKCGLNMASPLIQENCTQRLTEIPERQMPNQQTRLSQPQACASTTSFRGTLPRPHTHQEHNTQRKMSMSLPSPRSSMVYCHSPKADRTRAWCSLRQAEKSDQK